MPMIDSNFSHVVTTYTIAISVIMKTAKGLSNCCKQLPLAEPSLIACVYSGYDGEA
jgi:hypothetical protein